MNTLLQIIFLGGAGAMCIGLSVLIVLAPKPVHWDHHAQGFARLLMLGGSAFGAADILMTDWVPTWQMSVMLAGLGIGIGIHARQNHLVALLKEHLEKETT